MSTAILPGIIKVEFLPAEELILYPQKHLTPGDTISAIGNFESLPIIGLSSCVVTDERTDAGIVYSTKITGSIKDRTALNSFDLHRLLEKFHVFKITDVCRNMLLIGCDDYPYPQISFTRVNDDQPTGTNQIGFEINWKSTLPPIDLVVL